METENLVTSGFYDITTDYYNYYDDHGYMYDKNHHIGGHLGSSDGTEILTGAVFLTMAALGVVLNPLAIRVIATGKSTSKKIKILLINLAVADFISALVNPVHKLISIHKPEFSRNLLASVANWAFCTSVLWTMAISVERFVVVYFSVKAQSYMLKYRICVAIWVWLAGVLLVPNLYAQFVTKDLAENISIVLHVVPLATSLIMHSLIAIKICTTKRSEENRGTSRSATELSDNKIKVLRMLFVDAVVKTITTLPMLTEVFEPKALQHKDASTIRIILDILYMSNCFTTPLIYYAANKSFREDTRAIFRSRSSRAGTARIRRKLKKPNKALNSQPSNSRDTKLSGNLQPKSSSNDVEIRHI